MSTETLQHRVENLVLDAGPLITQPASQLQQLAEKFYTTPGVYRELKDESVRAQLIVWGDRLIVRHPKKEAIEAVVDFARLTGDSTVLSQNDLHVIALAYEIDIEANGGINNFRKFPGEIRPMDKVRIAEERKKWEERKKLKDLETIEKDDEKNDEEVEGPKFDEDGFEIVVNKKKSKPKPQSQHKTTEPVFEPVENPSATESVPQEEDLNAEYDDDDDDGEWITPDNIESVISREDDKEEVEKEENVEQISCALASGDFAAQNVALQMGMNLMNTMSGLQIKRVRNYMLRCHACFALVPIPKDNTPKHFCPSCGGPTLRRIAVSVNAATGKITPHLKKNFVWRTRGNIYSMPSPLSKKTTKKLGNKGHQHRGNSKLDTEFYAEDQREYQQAIKTAKWQQRQNEKAMEDFIGGGSADNYISPFFTGGDVKTVHVKVGRGKFANQSRKKH
ncbi:hypothetical protein CANINC_003008 [Pichia inconspicua]|uniref:20S-pre-rRNA D-site endonuclease NOB1 n=1 Tax=Pichia inconspicua TaxID=52247 RepID=A0A4T0WZS6_9ASCO|nr:hypothetical protein CANINC_003008 [[Candida] inconspicua]